LAGEKEVGLPPGFFFIKNLKIRFWEIIIKKLKSFGSKEKPNCNRIPGYRNAIYSKAQIQGEFPEFFLRGT